MAAGARACGSCRGARCRAGSRPRRPGAAASRGRCTSSCTSSSPGEGPLQDELVKLRGDRAVRNRELAARLGRAGDGGDLRGRGGRGRRRGGHGPAPLRPGPGEGGRGRGHRRRLRPLAGRRPARLRAQGPARPARRGPPGPRGRAAWRCSPTRCRPASSPPHLERLVAELADGRPGRDRGGVLLLHPRPALGAAPRWPSGPGSWPRAARTSTARSSPACSWGPGGATCASPTISSTPWRRVEAEPSTEVPAVRRNTAGVGQRLAARPSHMALVRRSLTL